MSANVFFCKCRLTDLKRHQEGAAYSIIRKLVCKETVTIICLWWQQVPSPKATVWSPGFSLHWNQASLVPWRESLSAKKVQ
jgi:hypothetical protein